MKREEKGSTRKKLALAAVLIGAVLCVLTFLFIQGVRQQLWEQSIGTIMESTQQGRNTLKIQLHDDYDSLKAAADNIEKISIGQKEKLDEMLSFTAELSFSP